MATIVDGVLGGLDRAEEKPVNAAKTLVASLIMVKPWRPLRNEERRLRIIIEPGKRSGQPCIHGMRMTVQDVLEYLAGGMSAEEVLTDFPELTAEDLPACLAFAANRERQLRV